MQVDPRHDSDPFAARLSYADIGTLGPWLVNSNPDVSLWSASPMGDARPNRKTRGFAPHPHEWFALKKV